jgi:hypothetical protein
VIFIKDWSIRAQILKLILVVGTALILVAHLSGKNAIHSIIWKGASAFWNNPDGYESAFTLTEWVAVVTPALALLLAWFAHHRDERHRGKGIKDIILREVGKEPYLLKTEVIAASMTKQSVLAAIAAVSLALIQQVPRPDLFGRVVWFLSTCGFAFAILFLLVSMVCYDYACRFHWPRFYRAGLVQKALVLDVYSWYFLLTSFLLSIVLINPRLSVITSVVAGVLMWWYYFFLSEKSGFKIRDIVYIKSGNHAQEFARIISFESTDPEPSYVVKLFSTHENIKVAESELEAGPTTS